MHCGEWLCESVVGAHGGSAVLGGGCGGGADRGAGGRLFGTGGEGARRCVKSRACFGLSAQARDSDPAGAPGPGPGGCSDTQHALPPPALYLLSLPRCQCRTSNIDVCFGGASGLPVHAGDGPRVAALAAVLACLS